MPGELPVISTKKALQLLAFSWCVFWWGFVFGMSNSTNAEIRYLQLRILTAEKIAKEASVEGHADDGIIAAERQRLEILQGSADSSLAYNILAPLTAPYAWYELHRLRISASPGR
jgi:hypothetical protein